MTFLENLTHAKTQPALLLALISTPLTVLLRRFVFDDFEFLASLLVVVGIDTITGILKHYKSGTLSSTGLGRFLEKLLVYAAALVVGHVLGNLTVSGQLVVFFRFAPTVINTFMISREAISVLENIEAIRPGTTPLWLRQRLAISPDKPDASK